MDGQRYEEFFLDPQESLHRHYEALRAVFVDGESMSEVAERLGVAHGTVRNWVCGFRSQYDNGKVSPFFSSEAEDVSGANPNKRTNSQLSLMSNNFRSKWAASCIRGSLVSFCFGRC